MHTKTKIGPAEIRHLGTIASAAFNELIRLGKVTFPKGRKTATMNAWRKRIAFESIGVESFTEVRREDFRTLREAYLDRAPGIADQFKQANPKRTGKRKGSSTQDDTHEESELWIFKLEELLKSKGRKAKIGEEYVLEIARCFHNRQKLQQWRDLPAYQLRSLFITINSRINRKLA